MKEADIRDVAIQLSGVRKRYRLGQIGGGTLQGDLQSWWARFRGKEDPNTIIGQEQRLVGQSFMALNGIDLTVYKGEALGIIGANGAGKSTLLKLLSRVTAPTAGEIDIYGRVTSMLEVGTGFNGEMTGRENIYMNGTILGMTRPEIDEKMEDIIEFSEVREFIDTPVKRYSSGMYVKLAFSVAAHLNSEIMIMDEVLAVGDMAFQKKCLDKMREAANKEGRTILYVSHNMSTIRQLCNRCIVLDKGQIVFDGDVENAIEVYLDCGKDDSIRRDYSGDKRPRWITDNRIQLQNAEFIGKTSNIFSSNEHIYLRLEWKVLRAVENLCFRAEICSLDGVGRASFIAEGLRSWQSGAFGCAVLKMDISELIESNYKMRFVMFATDESGRDFLFDYVEGLFFDKINLDQNKNITWNSKNWGFVRLADPEVVSIEEKT